MMNRWLRETYYKLRRKYNDPTIRNNISKLMYLSFIWLEDLQKTFDNLIDNLEESVYAIYFESIYIHRRS